MQWCAVRKYGMTDALSVSAISPPVQMYCEAPEENRMLATACLAAATAEDGVGEQIAVAVRATAAIRPERLAAQVVDVEPDAGGEVEADEMRAQGGRSRRGEHRAPHAAAVAAAAQAADVEIANARAEAPDVAESHRETQRLVGTHEVASRSLSRSVDPGALRGGEIDPDFALQSPRHLPGDE